MSGLCSLQPSSKRYRCSATLCFLLSILVLSAPAFARHGARPFHLSTETIDRPLVLPAHMWQIFVPAAVDFYIDDEQKSFSWLGLVNPLSPPIPRHSITDRFEFLQFPFPYFRFAIRQKTDIDDTTVRLHGFALSVDGGMYAISYSQVEGVGISGGINVNAKHQLRRPLWIEGELSLSALRNHLNEILYASLSPFIGFQLTPNIALGIWFSPRFILYPEIVYSHSAKFKVFLNPSPYFGISFSCYGFNYQDYWHIQPVIGLSFQW